MSFSSTPPPAPPWRDRLARRLALLSALMSALVLVPLIFGTRAPSLRYPLMVVTAVLAVALAWLSRARVSGRTRSLGVVATFFVVGCAGISTVGFLGAPTVGFALAVVLSGLLLGRRAMFFSMAAVLVAVLLIGTLMVTGVIPPPPLAEISPSAARPWLRSNALSMSLILILGATVTWVVDTVEAAQQRLEREAERRQQAERAVVRAQATELIGRLAAGLAHDVNNQLTVVSGWTSLLAQASDADERADAQRAVADAVTNASALTKQLLVLGRREPRVTQPVLLPKLVADYRQTLGRLLPHGIELVAHAEGEVWCLADETQLHHVLLNLVLNARDAMPHGGRIQIRSGLRRAASGLMGHAGPVPESDWAVLEVTDEGTGMDEATLARAFEPFFTTKPRGRGTGLGLATIAAVAEQSQGHVTIDTEVGRGTTFSLWLPRTGAGQDSAGTTAAVKQGMPLRVLLVEDSADVRVAASRMLKAAGHDVSTASDGDEALHELAESSFDLLCSDVIMPGASLEEVMARFSERNPGASVLLCSGHVDEEAVLEAIEKGTVRFLAKPYTLEALSSKVADLAQEIRTT